MDIFEAAQNVGAFVAPLAFARPLCAQRLGKFARPAGQRAQTLQVFRIICDAINQLTQAWLRDMLDRRPVRRIVAAQIGHQVSYSLARLNECRAPSLRQRRLQACLAGQRLAHLQQLRPDGVKPGAILGGRRHA